MRPRLVNLALVLGACLTLTACGDDSDEGGSGQGGVISCRVESAGNAVQCIEYRVPPSAVEATRDGCSAGGGMLVSRCPAADRLGTCRNTVSSMLSIVTHYYSGGLTPETAAELCSGNGGSWDPA